MFGKLVKILMNKFLGRSGSHKHYKYSSSDDRKGKRNFGRGQSYYGQSHYKKKKHSSFFSS
ncbi:hypothetical protein EIZ39_23020 [Ammoniphilus sp. CFH 90114]|nr:hypothetical protein EIZ39_23020 [Ammoniphilus sp. CFH 90114]